MAWFSFLNKKNAELDDSPKRSNAVFFTNTLGMKKEKFVPLKPGLVTMYSCGPTVYNYVHVGNLRVYVFADTIDRVLAYAGYRVRRVINITDFGHLTSDADEGDDKVEIGAKREGLSVEAIVERYTSAFMRDLSALNIDTSDILFPRATEYIKEQIAMAQTLEQKGFAYRTRDGLYFDTAKFPSYGELGGVHEMLLKESAKTEASHSRIGVNLEKRNPADFALWRIGKPNDLQQWDSPWGRGGPGWHIECSAMSRALLGQEIDIHTGGEDHIPIHHNNEIAQSEAVSNKKFVRYWMHAAFLTMNGEKASKSLGNIVLLPEVIEKGFHPLALRYFFFQANYHTTLSFSWDAVAGANEALHRLWRTSTEIAKESKRIAAPSEARDKFVQAMYDDLATPQAIGILWETLKDDQYSVEEKWGLLMDADALLGLSLINPPGTPQPLSEAELPGEVRELREKRDAARQAKDFKTADTLRTELENRGYRVDDGPDGTLLTKRRE